MSVLWIVLVVAFISFALAAAVRSELAAAGNSFDSERALFMAKSAAEVLFQKLQNPETFSEIPVPTSRLWSGAPLRLGGPSHQASAFPLQADCDKGGLLFLRE